MMINQAFILLFTHGLPILFFTYMATDVLLRNKRRTEHILLSVVSVCYLLLFVEEYVRNQVSIEYSPLLSSIWLSSVGIVITGLCFHFLAKLSQLEKRLPRYIYPYIFYLPLLFVAVNAAMGFTLISAHEFVRHGIWNLPVYNTGYYIAMTASIVTNILYLVPLVIAKANTESSEQKLIYTRLMWGVFISVSCHTLLGYIDYGGALPPYPYLYTGMIWCFFLRLTMNKHDFMGRYDKRFEKLFQLNPEAILLMDGNGTIKNANPGAMQLFRSMRLEEMPLLDMFDPELKARIDKKEPVKQYETELLLNGERTVLLVSADYVWVDYEYHTLLVLRNITLQKKYDEEIQFLAFHDSLTRLPNRRFFHEKLNEALLHANDKQETLALLLIDLDHIKRLNDIHGHLAGDEALKQAASILREIAKERGVASRMGGDEFVLYISGSPSPAEVQLLTTRMQDQFAIFAAKFENLRIGMSVGVSYYPEDGRDGKALIHIADYAMYEMKRNRNCARL
ncbi:diguanylate cyclase domain-containing protein [Paenibacillus sp. GCM10027627]|uniref:sensor domain-containing diguanylate cyclase n=1 Tax=unclassified Paenibacillus TaxID=185978 RepID=UPI00362EBF72